MTMKRSILLTALLLAVTSVANAALSTSSGLSSRDDGRIQRDATASADVDASVETHVAPAASTPDDPTTALARRLERECLAGSGLVSDSPWRSAATDGPVKSDEAESSGPQVTEIPPPPGSATLVLSALISVGGWQLGRSAKAHIHLGALPDWYHAECPDQIGHTYAIDLTFDVSVMPLCVFDEPVSVVPQPRLLTRRYTETPRLLSQQILSVTAPRGPPAVS